MNEADYWSHLEYRISRELGGLREKGRGILWCDGVMPEVFELDGPRPRLLGRAYCGEGGQDEWTFELLLPQCYQSREAIDWQALLPPDDVTRWLYFDRERRFLQIEPAAAVHDFS